MPRAELLALLLLAALLLASACSLRQPYGGEALPTSSPVERGGRSIAFTTSDGLTLNGRLFGQGDVGVVLAHMVPADQTSWSPFARRLAEEGYTGRTFDFRGYGQSQGPRKISKIDQDVRAALEELVSQGPGRVFLLGASMGGTALVIVAAEDGVAGVVSLSGPRSFQGLDAAQAAPAVAAPKLFIASQGDIAAQQSALWFRDNSSEPTGLRLFPGANHGTQLLEGEHRQAVEELLLAFLRDPQGTLETLN